MSSRVPRTLFAIGIPAFAAVVLGVVFILGRDSGTQEATSADNPTWETEASPTETAPVLVLLSGMMIRRDYALGEKPVESHGIAFADIQTGALESWHLDEAVHAGSHLADLDYVVDDSHRWIDVRYVVSPEESSPSQTTSRLITDRQTRMTFSVGPEWRKIAGPNEDGLLVAQAIAIPDQFVVIDMAADPTRVAQSFNIPDIGPVLEGDHTRLTRSGERLLMLLYESHPSGEGGRTISSNLMGVDLKSGEITVRIAARSASLHPLLGGGAVLVSRDETLKGPLTVHRFDAAGNPAGETRIDAATVFQYFVSPDGLWIAWQEQLPLRVQAGVGLPWHWPAIMIADLRTGQFSMRVLRADPLAWSGSHTAMPGEAAWHEVLNPGVVGLYILTPAPPFCRDDYCIGLPYRGPGKLGLLTMDGSVANLPLNFGIPLSDALGRFVEMSNTAHEIAITRNPVIGGRDGVGGVSSLALPPLVQFPPFPEEVRLRVATGGDALNLREVPGTESQIVAPLSDGTLLTVTDAPCPPTTQLTGECSVAPATQDGVDYWIHVRTDDGAEGWVSDDFVAWAE